MKQNKPVIGITGTIAAGKSTVSRYFRDAYGIPIIDADAVGHEVLSECPVKQELTKAFGSDILDADQGQVDRRKLGAIVFADAKALTRLNAITHPVICIRIEEAIGRTQEAEPEAPFLLVEAIELLRSPAEGHGAGSVDCLRGSPGADPPDNEAAESDGGGSRGAGSESVERRGIQAPGQRWYSMAAAIRRRCTHSATESMRG